MDLLEQDNETAAAEQADPQALIAGALLALLLKWGPARKDSHYIEEAKYTVLEFMREYPAIAAAVQMRQAGMQVMIASASLAEDTVLSVSMVRVLNEALEAAGAWDGEGVDPADDLKEAVHELADRKKRHGGRRG